MLFKQIQLFHFTDPSCYVLENLIEKLEQLQFKPCLPSTSLSIGWVPPIEEDDMPLAQAVNGNIMICLQIEEKILPATVVNQALQDKIKEIAAQEQGRKVYQKEKLNLKDEIIMTLLPSAFSKLTRIYAYIDTKNQWLVLSTCNNKKTEQFISNFKKSVSEKISIIALRKISSILTDWLKHKNYPTSFAIEKTYVLQDPKQQSRIIRCQQQDAFADGIQTLLKEGCEVIQLALQWQDQMHFVLTNNLFIQSIRFGDDIIEGAKEMEAETKLQHFSADFFIMTQTFAMLLNELIHLFAEPVNSKSQSNEAEVIKLFPAMSEA